MQSLKLLATNVALLASVGVTMASTVVFTDNTLNLANYTITNSLINNGGPITITPAQSGTVGNPAPGLQITFTSDGASALNASSFLLFVNNTFTYNPATQGAITSLNFSNDRFVDGGGLNALGLTTSSRFVIFQGGNLYYATILDPNGGHTFQSWFTTSATGLLATDFSLFNPATQALNTSLHPDFSAAGGVASFGFANRLSVGTPTPFALNAVFDFDNVSVSVNPTPEPATWGLIVIGIGFLAMLKNWRAGAR